MNPEKLVARMLGEGKTATVSNHLKARLASLFLTDSNDFLWRAEVADRADFHHRSWFGKIYVDYVMATECALKSAIIYLSPEKETPEEAYKMARKQNHHVTNLLGVAKSRSARRIKFVTKDCEEFFANLPFSVAARYDLELLHAHFSTKTGYKSRTNDSIRDHNFMRQLHSFTFEVVEFSRKASKRTKNKVLPMSGPMMGQVQDAFSKFKL